MCSKWWLGWKYSWYIFRALPDDTLWHICCISKYIVHMFLPNLWGIKRKITLCFFWISLDCCHVVVFRHCGLKTSNYRKGKVIHLSGKSSYIWACTFPLTHTHPLSQWKRKYCFHAWGCDLSKDFLLWPVCQTVWSAVEGAGVALLLDEKASNMCFLWHSNQPLLLPPSPTSPLLLSRRITGRNWTFDPDLLCAAAISIWQGSLYLFLLQTSLTWTVFKKRVKPFMLSPVWRLRFSCSLPGSRQDSWVTAMWEVYSMSPGVVQRIS